MADDYAGDISPKQAWAMLAEEPDAVLVDVRTDAEWTYVGLPDLNSIGKRTMGVMWQSYPDMAVNAGFVDDIRKVGPPPDAAVLLLCRSGVRSKAAAIALTAAGFRRCYNIDGGFEGPCDARGHRGGAAGWKADGLPWEQN